MLTYVVIHSALAPWLLPRRESGSSVKENRKGLRRLRLGVSGPSRSIPQNFLQNIPVHLHVQTVPKFPSRHRQGWFNAN